MSKKTNTKKNKQRTTTTTRKTKKTKGKQKVPQKLSVRFELNK